MRRLLVVGAQPTSLGAWVATSATMLSFGVPWDVTTAGIGDEMLRLDVTWSDEQLYPFLEEWGPFHAVVCTAGLNPPGGSIADVPGPAGLMEAMAVNYLGHMNLLYNWLRYWHEGSELDSAPPLSWVSISSNSAHIARTKSMAYCASKAALSMAIRVAGREVAGGPFSVYGYEPGWLDGTPMSEAKRAELDDRGLNPKATHRIPGGQGVDPIQLAGMIVGNLNNDRALNGCTLRVDGGEQ
jgi:NAD(P)-dependent dehydrogenase (short-subunit alcohol dehydrogenase family)